MYTAHSMLRSPPPPYCKGQLATMDIISAHYYEVGAAIDCNVLNLEIYGSDIHLSAAPFLPLLPAGSAVPLTATVVTPSHVFVPPPTFIMTNFSHHKDSDEEWFSPPFYSHIGGYKMCLGVGANGWGHGTGTHVSVVNNLMRGEYDDNLLWPFRGEITFQLINRRADEGHVEHTIPFDDSAPDSVTCRVMEGERAPDGGWGPAKFIPHCALQCNESWNTEYLCKSDSLEFRVTRVKVAERLPVLTAQQPSSGGEGVAPGKHSKTELELEYEITPTKKVERATGETELASKTSSVGGEGGVTRTHITSALQPSSDWTQTDMPVPPVTMVMRGFISWKMRDLRWFCPSFYSHIGGYKMCLGVDANGDGSAADTHVTVAVYLVRGEYDDNLVWPFRGDVTLHLVNRKVDEGHVERTAHFNDSTPDVGAGRVMEGERAPRGQGWAQFISHSALGYGRNTKFFDKDALEFRVTSVKVYSS